MKTDEVCSRPVRRVCSPCRSLFGWIPFVSCSKLIKSDAVVSQLVSQCVVAVANRLFLIGLAVRLSSRVGVSASRLSFVRHHWNLPSRLMVVSSLFVGRSFSNPLVESLRTCWVVGSKPGWFSMKIRVFHIRNRVRVGRQTHSLR